MGFHRVNVARGGLEPPTFHFSGERYYQLSYLAERSNSASATPTGLEPATSAVTGRRANQLRYGAWIGLTDRYPASPEPITYGLTRAKIGCLE